jgi:hypothetical protein
LPDLIRHHDVLITQVDVRGVSALRADRGLERAEPGCVADSLVVTSSGSLEELSLV